MKNLKQVGFDWAFDDSVTKSAASVLRAVRLSRAVRVARTASRAVPKLGRSAKLTGGVRRVGEQLGGTAVMIGGWEGYEAGKRKLIERQERKRYQRMVENKKKMRYYG